MRKERGITLIALIITIIIMLILVAVSISILINSGLIGKAKEGAEKTKSAYEQEQRIGETINIDGVEYTIDEYLQSIDEPSEYSADVKTKLALNLSAEYDEEKSPYVLYNNNLYKVLYSDDNSIEIISMDTYIQYPYGLSDENIPEEMNTNTQEQEEIVEIMQWEYNNLIYNLNKKTEQEFPRDNVVSDARCVGSVPGNKNNKISELFYDNVRGYEIALEYGEKTENCGTNTMDKNQPNYSSDLDRMTELGILDFNSNQYVLASRCIRYTTNSNGFIFFGIEELYGSGSPAQTWLCMIDEDGVMYSSGTFNIRPVLKLKKGVQIMDNGGDGSQYNPYIVY